MLSVVNVGVWFGIVGACISIALLAGHAYYLKRGSQLGASAKGGALFGLIAGAVAGAIAQGVYGGIGPTEGLRVICWGMAGGLLGYGLSFRIPNLGHACGLLGGLAGGVIGGGLFLIFTFGLSNQVVGRLLGLTAIGVRQPSCEPHRQGCPHGSC
jgi:Ca-activated chloride channel family protein